MSDLVMAISWFLSSSWDFFTEITVPGLGVSFAALLASVFLGGLGLRLLLMIIGARIGSDMILPILDRKKDDK